MRKTTMRSFSTTGNAFTAVTVVLVALLASSCFGRTGADGLGLADGEEGASCTRDANCRIGLVCIAGECGRVDSPVDRDAGGDADGTSVDPSSCPGFAGFIEVDQSVDGTTAGGENRYAAECGGGRAADVVWVLQLDDFVDINVTTFGSSFDTVLYVRDHCGDGPELVCNDDSEVGSGTTSSVLLPNLPPGDYFIYVDGWGRHEGSYTLNVWEAQDAVPAP